MYNNNTTALGIEFGSTRIKAVLVSDNGEVLASGSHSWENSLVGNVWTYSLDEAWAGIRNAYSKLSADVERRYGKPLECVGAIGVSGMMHGYLAFDKDEKQIAEFRTWRNTITAESAKILSEEFKFNVPQRWSIAHLYQAILNGEKDVNDVVYMHTLASYIHYKLTGRRVIGVGEASGMMPVDFATQNYDKKMAERFNELASEKGFTRPIDEIFPEIVSVGENAGYLTEEGAALLDIKGALKAGIPFCPPEGDMQTGMIATNSIRIGTGNVSAGTSVNACLIPESPIKGVYPEVDIIATPDGNTAALLHGNNCTSEIDTWAELFASVAMAIGQKVSKYQMLDVMFASALVAPTDADGIVYYNYLSGETMTGVDKGVPMLIRRPESALTLPAFSRAQLYAAVATMRVGLDILKANEDVNLSLIVGHGGYFKAPVAGQKMLSAALGVPVSVMKTAGEGGPWGMSLLALYSIHSGGKSLPDYLDDNIFSHQDVKTVEADTDDLAGFERYYENYKKGLAAEKAAVDNY